MKTVAWMQLQPGMVLGEDIQYQGRVLYSAGTTVDKLMIDKLKRYSIICAVIKENVDFATTQYEKILYSSAFKEFEKQYTIGLNRYKDLMMQFITNKIKVEEDVLLQIYEDISAKIRSGSVLLDYLYNMIPNEDELTFTQCLNAALLAGAFANWLGMGPEETRILVLCGFYYDIGKVKLPYDLLWKPEKLTEEEYNIIKSHPVIGYSMVRDLKLDEHVKNAIHMHHERMDGSGYPYHMTEKIDLYARYIAIVDTYIAMASPRAYRNAFTPLQILGVFENSMYKYDVELLVPLMKRIADAQIGTRIQLSDDSVWEVFIIHPNKFSRPLLKGKDNQILDLLEHPQLEIVKII